MELTDLRIRLGLSPRFAGVRDRSSLQAVAKLSGGQIIAAALSVLAAPILSRLYAPEDYAPFAVFVAVTSVCSSLGTVALSNGIIVERSCRRAHELAVVCLIVGGAATTAGALVIITIALVQWPAFGGAIGPWLFAVPLLVMVNCVSEVVSALANRQKAYGKLSIIPIGVSTSTVGLTLTLGVLEFEASGVMIGYLAGQAFALIAYLYLYASLELARPRVTGCHLIGLARRHRRFVYFSLPSSLIWSFMMALPVYALNWAGAMLALGEFNRARFLAGASVTLVSGAFGSVYRQRFVEDIREGGDCRATFTRAFCALLAIGLAPAYCLSFYGGEIFGLVLGETWHGVGEFAEVLAPMLLLRFIAAPLSQVFFLLGAQKLDFVLMLGGFTICAFLTAWPLVFSWPEIYIVAAFSCVFSCLYVVQILFAWRAVTVAFPGRAALA